MYYLYLINIYLLKHKQVHWHSLWPTSKSCFVKASVISKLNGLTSPGKHYLAKQLDFSFILNNGSSYNVFRKNNVNSYK